MSVINLDFSKASKGEKSPLKTPTLIAYILERSHQMEMHGHLGTARNYQKTANSITAFLKYKSNDKRYKSLDPPLFKLSTDLLIEYQYWLQEKNVKRNSISFYMRNIRAAYNHAVRNNQIIVSNNIGHYTANLPYNIFSHVYTGIDKTYKKAVKEEIVHKLLDLDLSNSSSLQFARDIFIFSYCARGISFIDLAFLKRKNITNGTLHYSRRKTGQQLSIAIEPCMQKILDKYISQKEKIQRDSSTPDNTINEYIFPIISLPNEKDAYRQYQTALGYYNRKLKELSGLIGGNIKLSSYSARHTWATVARNHNIPISVISAGMGHTSERTTQIYLQQLEDNIIDKANRRLLSGLNINI